QCLSRLNAAVARIDEYVAASRRGKSVLGSQRSKVPSPDERRRLAELVLPVVRGALSGTERVVLHLDDGDDLLAMLAARRTRELPQRGMATPEHLLRAGRLPVWLEIDRTSPPNTIVEHIRSQLAVARADYEAYHRRHAAVGQRLLDDWAKVVL